MQSMGKLVARKEAILVPSKTMLDVTIGQNQQQENDKNLESCEYVTSNGKKKHLCNAKS